MTLYTCIDVLKCVYTRIDIYRYIRIDIYRCIASRSIHMYRCIDVCILVHMYRHIVSRCTHMYRCIAATVFTCMDVWMCLYTRIDIYRYTRIDIYKCIASRCIHSIDVLMCCGVCACPHRTLHRDRNSASSLRGSSFRSKPTEIIFPGSLCESLVSPEAFMWKYQRDMGSCVKSEPTGGGWPYNENKLQPETWNTIFMTLDVVSMFIYVSEISLSLCSWNTQFGIYLRWTVGIAIKSYWCLELDINKYNLAD